MTKDEIIAHALHCIACEATIHTAGEATAESPIEFSPDAEFESGEPGLTMFAAVYERFNGTFVLLIDMPVVTCRRSPTLREELSKITEHLPFCSFRCEPVDGNVVEWKIVFTHSLLADENLSSQHIAQVIGSMMHTYDKQLTNFWPIVQSMSLKRRYVAIESPPVTNVVAKESPPVTNVVTKESPPVTNVMDEIDALVGLVPLKNVARQLVARQRVEALRGKAGFKQVLPSPHLVFTGNPGTGKTTVARLIGRLYKSLGLLKKGHVVEVNRGSLVAAYVGQTAIKTRQACEEALGGVLFIDEAYALLGEGNDFGSEVIEELLTFMEAHRGNFVVVAAGYPAEMEKLLGSNPGLRGRFDTSIHFPDFSDDELFKIFEKLVIENDYVLRGVGENAVKNVIRHLPRGEYFGNGREMRQLFNSALDIHAVRLARYPRPAPAMLRELNGFDFYPMIKESRLQRRSLQEQVHMQNRGESAYAYGGYL